MSTPAPRKATPGTRPAAFILTDHMSLPSRRFPAWRRSLLFFVSPFLSARFCFSDHARCRRYGDFGDSRPCSSPRLNASAVILFFSGHARYWRSLSHRHSWLCPILAVLCVPVPQVVGFVFRSLAMSAITAITAISSADGKTWTPLPPPLVPIF